MLARISNRLRRLNAVVYPRHLFQPPKWLVLGVNNTCNLHCKMCDVGVNYTQSNFFENLMGTRPVHMPMELFRTIADQAAQHYPAVKIGYAFTEPLIYVHLEKSLKYVSQKGLFTSITTNGLGLKKWAGLFAEVHLNELNISLDGPADIHNQIRGNQHSYSKAIEGIEALAALTRTTRINIFCVITEWNIGHLVRFLSEMRTLPIHHVGLMHSNFTPQSLADVHNEIFGGLYPATASNITETHNDCVDVSALWDEIRKIKASSWNFQVTFHPEIGSQLLLEQYYLHPEIFLGRRCLDIFSNLMIKSNGDVIPAHGRCFNLTIGNIYHHPLPAIWNSAVAADFRQRVTDNGGLLPACSRCCSAFVR